MWQKACGGIGELVMTLEMYLEEIQDLFRKKWLYISKLYRFDAHKSYCLSNPEDIPLKNENRALRPTASFPKGILAK